MAEKAPGTIMAKHTLKRHPVIYFARAALCLLVALAQPAQAAEVLAHILALNGFVFTFDTVTQQEVAFANSSQGMAESLAVSADGFTYYTANTNSNTVSVFQRGSDIANTPQNAGTIRGDNEVAVISVGNGPAGIAATPDGKRVYVANGTDSTVSVIDAVAFTVITTLPVCTHPQGIAVSPDGKLVYVTCQIAGALSAIRTSDNSVTATISMPAAQPVGVVFSPDSSRAYVAQNFAQAVAVIDTASAKAVASIALPPQSSPLGIAVSPDGKTLYVANSVGNTVSVLNAGTNAVTATIPVGVNPVGVSVTPDGSQAWVCDVGSRFVSIINTANNTAGQTFNITTQPKYCFGTFIAPGVATGTGSAAQTIVFGNAPGLSVGSGYDIGFIVASASSGLPLTYSTLTPLVCSIAGTTVTALNQGYCQIQASQAGDATYAPLIATQQIAIEVSGATPTSSLATSANPTPFSQSITVTFTAPASFSRYFDRDRDAVRPTAAPSAPRL